MKTILFLVFLTPALVLAQNTNPQPTFAQYQLHRASNKDQPQPLDHWIDGFLTATLGRVVSDQLDRKAPDFCPPSGSAVRQGILDNIDRYTVFYGKTVAPLSRDMPLSAVITRTLIYAYPCRPTAGVL